MISDRKRCSAKAFGVAVLKSKRLDHDLFRFRLPVLSCGPGHAARRRWQRHLPTNWRAGRLLCVDRHCNAQGRELQDAGITGIRNTGFVRFACNSRDSEWAFFLLNVTRSSSYCK